MRSPPSSADSAITPAERQRHIDDVARAWVALQRNWWAFERLGVLCAERPDDAWLVLVQLAAICDSDELAEDLGAGPLEDFVRLHAPAYLSAIVDLAERSATFRTALRHVQLPQSDDPVSKRLFGLGVQSVATERAPWQGA